MSLNVAASHAYRNWKMEFKALRRSPFNMNLGGVHGPSNASLEMPSSDRIPKPWWKGSPLFVAAILMAAPEALAVRPAYCTSACVRQEVRIWSAHPGSFESEAMRSS
jgi:hypothetical protein